MNNSHCLRPLWSVLIAGVAMVSVPAYAASKTPQAEAAAIYKQELAACNNGQTKQTHDACVREAGAAYAEARRGLLGDGMTVDPSNAIKRCDVQRGKDRVACEARMQGQGTTTGTAADGGILREIVTVETVETKPAPPAVVVQPVPPK